VSHKRMLCEAEMMACKPDPHNLLTLKAGVPSAHPPLTAATRERYMSLGSGFTTSPNTTWPTSFPSTCVRAHAARTACVASTLGGTSLRLPPKVRMAVRVALTTRTSRLMKDSWAWGGEHNPAAATGRAARTTAHRTPVWQARCLTRIKRPGWAAGCTMDGVKAFA